MQTAAQPTGAAAALLGLGGKANALGPSDPVEAAFDAVLTAAAGEPGLAVGEPEPRIAPATGDLPADGPEDAAAATGVAASSPDLRKPLTVELALPDAAGTAPGAAPPSAAAASAAAPAAPIETDFAPSPATATANAPAGDGDGTAAPTDAANAQPTGRRRSDPGAPPAATPALTAGSARTAADPASAPLEGQDSGDPRPAPTTPAPAEVAAKATAPTLSASVGAPAATSATPKMAAPPARPAKAEVQANGSAPQTAAAAAPQTLAQTTAAPEADMATAAAASPTSDRPGAAKQTFVAAADTAKGEPAPTPVVQSPNASKDAPGDAPIDADVDAGRRPDTAPQAALDARDPLEPADPRREPAVQLAARRFQSAMAQQAPAAQIAFTIAQNAAGAADRIRMQLYPRELGEVEIVLNVQEDRRADVVVRAERPETMELLQRDARELQRALQAAGLDVEQQNLSFELGGHSADDGASDAEALEADSDDAFDGDRFEPPPAPRWRMATPGGVDMLA